MDDNNEENKKNVMCNTLLLIKNTMECLKIKNKENIYTKNINNKLKEIIKLTNVKKYYQNRKKRNLNSVEKKSNNENKKNENYNSNYTKDNCDYVKLDNLTANIKKNILDDSKEKEFYKSPIRVIQAIYVIARSIQLINNCTINGLKCDKNNYKLISEDFVKISENLISSLRDEYVKSKGLLCDIYHNLYNLCKRFNNYLFAKPVEFKNNT